jgi:hypothetical protein
VIESAGVAPLLAIAGGAVSIAVGFLVTAGVVFGENAGAASVGAGVAAVLSSELAPGKGGIAGNSILGSAVRATGEESLGEGDAFTALGEGSLAAVGPGDQLGATSAAGGALALEPVVDGAIVDGVNAGAASAA